MELAFRRDVHPGATSRRVPVPLPLPDTDVPTNFKHAADAGLVRRYGCHSRLSSASERGCSAGLTALRSGGFVSDGLSDSMRGPVSGNSHARRRFKPSVTELSVSGRDLAFIPPVG